MEKLPLSLSDSLTVSKENTVWRETFDLSLETGRMASGAERRPRLGFSFAKTGFHSVSSITRFPVKHDPKTAWYRCSVRECLFKRDLVQLVAMQNWTSRRSSPFLFLNDLTAFELLENRWKRFFTPWKIYFDAKLRSNSERRRENREEWKCEDWKLLGSFGKFFLARCCFTENRENQTKGVWKYRYKLTEGKFRKIVFSLAVV